MRNEKEEENFTIEYEDRKSPVTVTAIHGGLIEPGTNEIAKELSGEIYNFYIFKGFKPKDGGQPENLHITSTNFYDKRLFCMLENSKICISIHGSKDKDEENRKIYLNGTNKTLMNIIKSEMISRGIRIGSTSEILDVHNKGNFIEIPSMGGVQFEIPASLRKEAMNNPEIMKIIAGSIQDSIEKFMNESYDNCRISSDIGFF